MYMVALNVGKLSVMIYIFIFPSRNARSNDPCRIYIKCPKSLGKSRHSYTILGYILLYGYVEQFRMSLAGQNIDRFTSNLNTQLSIYLSLPICFDVNSWGGAFKSANAKSVRLFHMLGRFCCVFF